MSSILNDIFEINNIYLYIIAFIFVISCIVITIFVIKKSNNNGSSSLQYLAGKKIGELCSSNGMCATNKCDPKLNICTL
jgi:hypothetical protein